MNGPYRTDPPIEEISEVAGSGVPEAFSLLGNETRVAILLALWEEFDPFGGGTWDPTEGNSVSFSELRDRVGLRQGAQFNYHLGKLVGQFVRKTDEGYELSPAGKKVVRTIIGIAGFDDATLDPTEIDLACPLCRAPTAITYRDQRLYRVCTECDGYHTVSDEYPNGVLMAALANPAVLENRSPETIFAAIRTQIYHQYGLRIGGICPECSGRVESRLHVCEDHEPGASGGCPSCGRRYDPAVRFVCTVCKHWNSTSVAEVSMRHPAVVAFCWDHGIELGYDSLDTARMLSNLMERVEQELVSADPPRIRVTVRYEDDELEIVFDDELNAVEVSDGEITAP